MQSQSTDPAKQPSQSSTAKHPDTISSHQTNRLRILIVDDDINLCQLLKDTLEEYDLEAVYAETSESALKLMQEFKPEVALVDFRLGKETGIEVAHSLKSLDEDLPVIIMTAYPSLDLAVKAIQSDIYDFLGKPVDNAYLLRSINKAVEKRNLSQENKKLIASLKQSNTTLEKLNRMKSKFLSIVTHDLRTPLTSVRGYSEMLKLSEDMSEEDRVRCFSAIEKSVDRMNGLISNLLDMVSIEAGKLRVEKTSINFTDICKELKETFKPVAESRKVSLEWEWPSTPVMVLGDSNRLSQVITNFVSNSFKHIPDEGKIAVKVSVNGKMVLTEVIDNGEGISPEDQARIFEQFYQVESSATKRQGLGLGLAISQEIMHSHQGEIGVFSEGLGKGTRFWLTLPIETSE